MRRSSEVFGPEAWATRTLCIDISPGPSAIATVLLSSTSTAISWPRVSMLSTWKVSCQSQGTDRYGRTIAACTVQGEDIEAWMVANGWALAYRKYSTDYVAQEQAARDAQVGLWRGEFVPPGEWRRGERLGQLSAFPDEEEQFSPLQPQLAACCKICRKGKACGNSCINKAYNCTKPPGCACDGN